MALRKILCLVFTLLLALTLGVSCDMFGTGGGGDPTPSPDDGNTLSRIEVTPDTIETRCFVGQTIKTTDIEVIATYNNGTTKKLGESDVTIIQPDTSEPGESELTVTYEGVSAYVTIEVEESIVERISVTGFEKEYLCGSQISTDKVVVRVTYDDGHTEEINYGPDSGITITLPDTSVVGYDYSIRVGYGGKTTSFNIDVIDPITSIELDNPNYKLILSQGTDSATVRSKLSNLKVKAIYHTGKTEVIDYGLLTIDFNQIVTETPTTAPVAFDVKYREMTIKAYYEVTSVPTFLSIAVGNGFKRKYLPGSILEDLSENLEVSVITGNDDTIEGIKYGSENEGRGVLTVSGYDKVNTSEIGAYTITVTYTEIVSYDENNVAVYGDSISTNVDITVVGIKSITVSGIKTDYGIGDKFDSSFADAVITIEYENGETVSVNDIDRANAEILTDKLTIGGDTVKTDENGNTNDAGIYKIEFRYFDTASDPIKIRVKTAIEEDLDGDDNVTEKVTP